MTPATKRRPSWEFAKAKGSGKNLQTDNGAVIGATTLGGACTVYQFFIYRDKIIAPSICSLTAPS